MSPAAPRNLLHAETSPYLLQHKDNPVHWRPWGASALSEARAQNKPVLLSIGYAACHWCHVMAHESFESEAIARIMNERFINIKVDREERPDLDAIYQTALNVLGEQGGWPLTMFLKPDGSPFWGGTYFPPESRYGRPGFPHVLTQVSDIYATRNDQVEQNAQAIGQAIRQTSATRPDGSLTMAVIDEAAISALQLMDVHRGGTKGAPKFPQPTFFRFLWSAYLRSRDQRLFEAVVVTLNNLCQGGIYDHLGGGFSRYAVDEEWLVPHFEKMLYDNALLVELLCDVWQETGLDLYKVRVRETLSWMLSDLRNGAADAAPSSHAAGAANNDGLFALASAFDADSEGEEGKYYVWSQAEIHELLGDDAVEFCHAYDVTPAGNWEGHTILRRRTDDLDPDLNGDADTDINTDGSRAKRLAAARTTLLAVRGERIAPQRDHKILADWNGMAVTALVRAGTLFDEPYWIDQAKAIYAFVKTRMTDHDSQGQNQRHHLHHTWCAGHARHPAVLDDYANMARAALALHQVSHDANCLADARAWVAIADRHYGDKENEAYYLAADHTDDLIVRTKTLFDNAVPSGNGVMLEVLARLYHLSGEADYGHKARELAMAMAPEDSRAIINQPSLALGYEILDQGLQIVVIAPSPDCNESHNRDRTDGEDHDREAQALIRAALESAPPRAIISLYHESGAIPMGHPAMGKKAVRGCATAYICQGTVCGLPVSSPADLVAALTLNAGS